MQNGAGVVAALLPRLWRGGGHCAIQAAQIAWECREVAAIRESVIVILDEMGNCDDFAVRRIAEMLATRWAKQLGEKRGELSPIYYLKMPSGSRLERFDGWLHNQAPRLDGLGDDIEDWTSHLDEPIGIIAKASGLDVANIRIRIAQRMQDMGGAALFGRDADLRQQHRLRSLSLECKFRRLLTDAAWRATREVIGELVAADAIDPEGVPYALCHAAAFPLLICTVPFEPRSKGVPQVDLSERYRPEARAGWLASSQVDAKVPVMPGHVVVASVSRRKCRYAGESWIAEQYYGPSRSGIDNWTSMSKALASFPCVLIPDDFVPLYDGPVLGAVVMFQPDYLGTIEPCTLSLCPRVASSLGWQHDRDNVLSIRDGSGEIVARTVRWRDGGVRSSFTDDAMFGQGTMLVVAEDKMDQMRAFLSPKTVTRAWHTIRGDRTSED